MLSVTGRTEEHARISVLVLDQHIVQAQVAGNAVLGFLDLHIGAQFLGQQTGYFPSGKLLGGWQLKGKYEQKVQTKDGPYDDVQYVFQ